MQAFFLVVCLGHGVDLPAMTIITYPEPHFVTINKATSLRSAQYSELQCSKSHTKQEQSCIFDIYQQQQSKVTACKSTMTIPACNSSLQCQGLHGLSHSSIQ
ncbi:TPA: hypothetical protein ACH3X1_000906 [Trebouxia sp. C0004]